MSTEADPKTSSPDESPLFGAPPTDLPKLTEVPPSRRTTPGDVQVVEVDLAKAADRARFMDVADPLYRDDPHYIAPLRIEQNKFLTPDKNRAFGYLDLRAFIAVKGGEDVGRLTVQVDSEYEKHNGRRVGFFGFFESTNDRTVAHALLATGLAWLREKGCVEVFGPANFTLNHPAGLIVDNFSRPPFVESTYNLPYYEELLTSFGLGKAKDLYIWWMDIQDGLHNPKRARIARIAEKIAKREGVRVRHGDLSKVDREIALIHEIYVGAWEQNWGFAPPPKEEFVDLAHDLKKIAWPELTLFVEYQGKPVAFAFTLPNIMERMPRNGRLFPFAWTRLLNLKKCRHARLWTLGTLPEYRKRGLESLLFIETVKGCLQHGYVAGEVGWTLEDNHLINRAIESMDGHIDRTYRIFGMDLS